MTPNEPGRLRRAASTVRRWRDWPLVTKLSAMLLAPAVVIVALGGVLISSQVQTARADATQAALVRLEVRAHAAISAVDGASGGRPPQALAGAARSFRDAVRGAKPGVGVAPAPLPGQVAARATAADSKLRSLLGSGAGSAPAYADARGALLAVEQSVAGHLSDPNSTGLARSLHRMDSATPPGRPAAARATAKKLSSTARGLADSSSNRIGIAAVLLLVALVVCAAVAVVVARALVVSLRRLRSRTDDVAERALPDAVHRVRQGEQISTEVTPIPVTTGDELGALARSFEVVEGQALRLAAEQAGLRAEAGGVLVNLSRRSQSLVQRQLRLLERLERDEEDPEQLDTLFQLDHLATRMRRNNENLMVLSGGEPGRGGKATMTVAEVLQAAVSEIEQYQRVHIAPPAEATVLGYAASDLVRMLAELLDNATSFSAPETTVALNSAQTTDGTLRLEVRDEGVGMSEADLAAANAALATSEPIELPAARQMGLFVVGRLATQYGVAVRLAAQEGGQGLRASLVLPPALLGRAAEESQAEVLGAGDEPEPASWQAPTRDDESPAPLPTRQRGQAARQAGIPVAEPSPAARGGEPAPAAPAPREEETTETIQGSWFLPVSRPDRNVPGDLFVPEAPAAVSAARDMPAAVHQEPPRDSQEKTQDTTQEPPREEPFDVFAAATPVQEAAPEPPGEPEGTPIFDDMASAWFADPAAGGHAAPDGGPASPERSGFPTVGWSDADSGWHQADAAARQAPASFTESGLPMRTPRARLVPGSMGVEGERQDHAENGKHRDPEEVRDRYSGFLRGLSEGGRDQPAEQSPAPHGDTDDLTRSGLPKRTRGAALVPREEPGDTPPSVPDSKALRDRLASLQNGISRGRAESETQPGSAEDSSYEG